MMRNLKTLSLAIAAMLALGAMASAASAAEEFHSESASTELKGEQPAEFNDKWTFDAGTVECQNVTYTGTISSATASEVELSPSYSGCTAAFGASVTIHMNGCDYADTALTHVKCPAGKVAEITSPGCTITVPPQNGINGVVYDNTTGPPKDIDVTVKANNIIYEEHNKGFFPTCANNTKLTSNGQYSGSATVRGFSGGKATGIWWE
jgi:hypothetical protein